MTFKKKTPQIASNFSFFFFLYSFATHKFRFFFHRLHLRCSLVSLHLFVARMIMELIESNHFTIVEYARYGSCLTRISSICDIGTSPICRFSEHFVLDKFMTKMNEMNVPAFCGNKLGDFVESFVCWKEKWESVVAISFGRLILCSQTVTTIFELLFNLFIISLPTLLWNQNCYKHFKTIQTSDRYATRKYQAME